MRDKLIKEVYDRMIGMVNNTNYLDYLYQMYSDKEINESNYNKVLEIILKLEINKWSRYTSNSIKAALNTDPAYEKIREISSLAYEYACNRTEDTPSITEEEVKQYIRLLNREYSNVESYNRSAAEQLVSEAIVDFKYAAGNNELTSFRFNHNKK